MRLSSACLSLHKLHSLQSGLPLASLSLLSSLFLLPGLALSLSPSSTLLQMIHSSLTPLLPALLTLAALIFSPWHEMKEESFLRGPMGIPSSFRSSSLIINCGEREGGREGGREDSVVTASLTTYQAIKIYLLSLKDSHMF